MDVPKEYHPEEFRSEYGLDAPFVLYLGRREADKGWPWLMDVFAGTKTPVKLVSAGAGHPDVPPRLRGRVIDVGYLTVEQRNNALAAALAYMQPVSYTHLRVGVSTERFFQPGASQPMVVARHH